MKDKEKNSRGLCREHKRRLTGTTFESRREEEGQGAEGRKTE